MFSADRGPNFVLLTLLRSTETGDTYCYDEKGACSLEVGKMGLWLPTHLSFPISHTKKSFFCRYSCIFFTPFSTFLYPLIILIFCDFIMLTSLMNIGPIKPSWTHFRLCLYLFAALPYPPPSLPRASSIITQGGRGCTEQIPLTPPPPSPTPPPPRRRENSGSDSRADKFVCSFSSNDGELWKICQWRLIKQMWIIGCCCGTRRPNAVGLIFSLLTNGKTLSSEFSECQQQHICSKKNKRS